MALQKEAVDLLSPERFFQNERLITKDEFRNYEVFLKEVVITSHHESLRDNIKAMAGAVGIATNVVQSDRDQSPTSSVGEELDNIVEAKKEFLQKMNALLTGTGRAGTGETKTLLTPAQFNSLLEKVTTFQKPALVLKEAEAKAAASAESCSKIATEFDVTKCEQARSLGAEDLYKFLKHLDKVGGPLQVPKSIWIKVGGS